MTLTARGSIRGRTSGRSICLKLREYQAGATSDTLVNSAQTCVTTNGAWQSFPALTYNTQQNGSYVDALVFQTSAGSAGEIFYVDGLSVSEPGSPSVHLRRCRATRCCSAWPISPPAGRRATRPPRGCSTPPPA